MPVRMHVQQPRIRSRDEIMYRQPRTAPSARKAAHPGHRAHGRAPGHRPGGLAEERETTMEDTRNGMPGSDLRGAIWGKGRRRDSQGTGVELADLPRRVIAVRHTC